MKIAPIGNCGSGTTTRKSMVVLAVLLMSEYV
jgi:hypothetical protein